MNRLVPDKGEGIWDIFLFLEKIREPMILLLLVTGVRYAAWGEAREMLTIFLVILALVGAEVLMSFQWLARKRPTHCIRCQVVPL